LEAIKDFFTIGTGKCIAGLLDFFYFSSVCRTWKKYVLENILHLIEAGEPLSEITASLKVGKI